jgi:hypothetical protein
MHSKARPTSAPFRLIVAAGLSLIVTSTAFAGPQLAKAIATDECIAAADGSAGELSAEELAMQVKARERAGQLVSELMSASSENNYQAIDGLNKKMVADFSVDLNNISSVFKNSPTLGALERLTGVSKSSEDFIAQSAQLKKDVNEMLPDIRGVKEKTGDGLQRFVGVFSKKLANKIGEGRDASTSIKELLAKYEKAVDRFQEDSDTILTAMPDVFADIQKRQMQVKEGIFTFEEAVIEYERTIEENKGTWRASELQRHQDTLTSLSNTLTMLYDAYDTNEINNNLLYKQYRTMKDAQNKLSTKGRQSLEQIKSAVVMLQTDHMIQDMQAVTAKLMDLADLGRQMTIESSQATQLSADELKRRQLANAQRLKVDAGKVQTIIEQARKGEMNSHAANMQAVAVLKETMEGLDASTAALKNTVDGPKVKRRGFN